MPLIRKPMRYAHPEGHTDVCYFTGEKKGLVTCGSDGDVRSWLNLMDDDPAANCISEQAISVISKNGKIFVGNDNNTVQILTYPDLEKEGIVTRFSAPVSALATTKNSNLIVSGACDMRIQVTNINTSDTIELEGHEAPILGLSLDPKQEFVASSSADGSIRVWNIREKRIVNIWNNVVPKCNSFFTAKAYCVPSFNCKDGDSLAYPHNKDVVIVARSSWKESFRLKCINIKSEISICKFSECGSRLAASTTQGEIIVWDVESKELIGYIEHQQSTKITSFVWNIDKPDEIAFCDSLGQLGCIDVLSSSKTNEPSENAENNGDIPSDEHFLPDDDDDDDDDDGENVISISRIKASIDPEADENSRPDLESEKPRDDEKTYAPEIHVQPPFQPGSSPVHLLSRYMVWNETGMVRCFASEDDGESSIEVEFHDITIHRSMHINNYLRHTIAALSGQALALNCPSSDDTPSKLVVVALQGWGSGNKEWITDLPEGEEGQTIAAGDNFVALSTSRRNLRIFTVGGTQREVVALPGPVVAMNGSGSNLVISYHDGIGVSGDQHMKLLLLRIRGPNIRNQTLSLPLSPSSELMWLGLSDLGSPVIMDSEDVIKVYNRKSSLWTVAADMSTQAKGKADHYFLISLSEQQSLVCCIRCKGSYYPPTSPRPVVTEINISPPLCEPSSEKTQKELKLWQLGSNPADENEAMLSLIAHALRSNLEYRAVELCELLASDKVIELAIKYAQRLKRVALSNKLESIADSKDQRKAVEIEEDNIASSNDVVELEEDVLEEPCIKLQKKPDIEIRPLPMSSSLKRTNPFLKSGNSPISRGLAGLDKVPAEKVQKLPTSFGPTKAKSKEAKEVPKKESFVSWYGKNKKTLQEEFPDLSPSDLTKMALGKYKKEIIRQSPDVSESSKKRKLSDPEGESSSSQSKRATSKTLEAFAFTK